MKPSPAVSTRHVHLSRQRFTKPLAALAAIGVLLLIAATAWAGHPVKGKTYKGTTSENGTVAFKVAKNGKQVLGFATTLGYDGKCGTGGFSAVDGVKLAKIAIKADGTFRGSVQAKPVSGVGPTRNVTVSGRFNGKKATGTVADPTHCTTASSPLAFAETFSAKAH